MYGYKVMIITCSEENSSQVECHAYFMQKPLYAFCKQHGITFTAYGPLGSPERPNVNPNDPVLLQEPKLKEIAEKHNKTPAQASASVWYCTLFPYY